MPGVGLGENLGGASQTFCAAWLPFGTMVLFIFFGQSDVFLCEMQFWRDLLQVAAAVQNMKEKCPTAHCS